MTEPHALDAPALRTLALELAEREHREHHWSVRATILGRIEDEGLYKTVEYGEHPTGRAWALHALGWPPGRYRVFVYKLWPMLRRTRAEIPFTAWGQLSQAKAEALARVLASGADVAPWFTAAVNERAMAFYLRVAALSPEPKWRSYRLRIPVTLDPVRVLAYNLAARFVLGAEPADPARLDDQDVAFRLFERVLVYYALHGNDLRDAMEPTDPALAMSALMAKLDPQDMTTLSWMIRYARTVGAHPDAEEA